MDYREPRHVPDDAIWCPDCGWVGRMADAVVGSDGERLCPDCHAVGVETPVERDPDSYDELERDIASEEAEWPELR